MKPSSCPSSRISAALAFTLFLGPLIGGCSGRMPNAGLASSHENSDAPTKSASPGGAALVWVRFEDPFEQSFSVEVPKGWTVRGGLFRMGYSDERPMVDLLSPDGLVNVRLGDLAIPTYALPNQYHSREGEVNDLGAQAQLVVARYRTGPEFAVLYSHVRFYSVCHEAAGDAANVDFSVPDYIPSDGSLSNTSTGAIAYRCGSGAGERIAFVYDRTSQAGGVWSVPTIGSFLSAPDKVGMARAVLQHCAQTFKLNPVWMEKQKQLDAYALQYQRARQQQRVQALAQQVQQFEAKMQAMRDQVAGFERHQAAQASQVEGFTQALRGVTPTIDPFTGEAREVWTGPKSNYWTNGTAVVNSTNAPPGWQQMRVTGP
ncbi:hypothetical protein P8935_16930 [Telmatobacter sp. DSM 110680]|uniref:Lipoprotein n=1 Tax=Telmatobacter sp. DSM 110680 TaxID=3036704 RepID=A0AAU7DGH5_9BACT